MAQIRLTREHKLNGKTYRPAPDGGPVDVPDDVASVLYDWEQRGAHQITLAAQREQAAKAKDGGESSRAAAPKAKE